MRCRFEGCPNPALPDQSRCELHRLRWAVGKPVEREAPVPEWRKHLTAKEFRDAA